MRKLEVELARNQDVSPKILDELVDKFDPRDRNLGEVLIRNRNLSTEALTRLIKKCPLELQILAISHPNLSFDEQVKIVSAVNSDELRNKAKLVLLERQNLDTCILAVLCLDPNTKVRNKAQLILERKLDDSNGNNRQ